MTSHAPRPAPFAAPWVRTVHALALVAATTAGGLAQAQNADVARGRLLYELTPEETGINSLQRCTNCHISSNAALDPVAERRLKIGGSEFAAITPALARTRLSTVGLNEPDMAQFRTTLSAQDLDDLAAYIADTPKTSADSLELSAPAAPGTGSDFFKLTHSTATTFPLIVNSVVVTGSNANAFVASGCAGQTLPAGNECTVLVQFTTTDTARKTGQVVLSLRQQGVDFTRTVAVSGGVSGVTPPGSGGGGLNPNGTGGSGGGGALGGAWLLALAAAALAARRVKGATARGRSSR